MPNDLSSFAEAYNDVQVARQGFPLHKEPWYSWNYWAQHTQKEFSFGRWMAENNLDYEDVAGSKTQYPEAEVVYDRTYGFRYYSAWRGAQKAKQVVEEIFDNIFRELWSAQEDEQFIYSNSELGAAIGMTSEQLRKFAAKRSWYFPRKTKGTK
jgi:hypothetical protein